MMRILQHAMVVTAGAALLVAGAASPAAAQPTKESLKCSSSKLKAAGKDAAAKLKCYSKAVQKALPVDAECLSKAEGKSVQSFDKADLKGGCAADADFFDTNGDTIPDGQTPSIINTINDGNAAATIAGVNDIQASLIPTPTTESKCTSKKVGAASKLIGALLNCESKAAKKNIPVDGPKCVDKAIAKYGQAIDKEESKVPNDCQTTGDRDQIGLDIFQLSEILTPMMPRFDGCGNSLVTPDGQVPAETCDDGNLDNFDFCPSTCFVEFCEPTTTIQQVTVNISDPNLASVTAELDYPEGKLFLEGSGPDIAPGAIIGNPGTLQGNDFDHALRLVVADAFAFGTTQLAQIQFTTCTGAPAPVLGDLTCQVTQAGDENAEPVEGVTCSVTIP